VPDKLEIFVEAMSFDDLPEVKRLEEESLLSAWSLAGYQAELLREDSLTFVAKISGQIVGFAIARLIMNFATPLTTTPPTKTKTTTNSTNYTTGSRHNFNHSIYRYREYCHNDCPSRTSLHLPQISEIEILNIAVKKTHRRKGVASALLEKLKEHVSDKKIHLEVRESNLGAISFYERKGFKITGLRKNFYRNPTENALLMTFPAIDSEKNSDLPQSHILI
jgi:ribosomal protein S18 acetylase RimI-like enzyme